MRGRGGGGGGGGGGREGEGVVCFYRPAVLRKSLYQSAVSLDTVLRFIKFFSAFLRFSQPFHSRLTIREFTQRRFSATQVNWKWTFFTLET